MLDSGGRLRDRLVATTRDLMLIPSCAERPEEIQRCAEYIVNHLEILPGITIERIVHHGHITILALPQGIRTPRLLLNGHLDVVVHTDQLAYHSTIRDGRIYGPGAGDMKGQLAILLALFHDFHRAHPGCSLGLAITSDEEIGGRHGIGHLFGDLGFRCGGAIVPDGGSLNEVTVEEKGVLYLRLRTAADSAHAARPWLTDNALARLVTVLERVRVHAQAWVHAQDHWYPTCTATMLQCDNRTPNRIPEAAEALVDIRFPPPWNIAGMKEEMLSVVAGDAEVTFVGGAEATHLAPDPAYLRAIEEVTGTPARLARVDGASDARYMQPHGIPVMMSRPLVGNLHAPDEWIGIASMETFYQYCGRFITHTLTSLSAD
jgi:succinyl-diaminopimelate desuccinylase